MEALLIRLLITALVIWLAQVILGAMALQEPANKIIFIVVVVLAVLWLITGVPAL